MSDGYDCVLNSYLALTRKMKQRYVDNLALIKIFQKQFLIEPSRKKEKSGNLSI